MSTLLYLKQITNKTYCIAQGILLNIMWQPGWERSLGRMDICMCLAETLCCLPETITTFLISYVLFYVKSLSHVQVFATAQTAAGQAPLSMGILQARILEWVAMPSSRMSSQPRDQTQVSYIARRFFII